MRIMVNGVAQKPIDGVSMVYTFDDAKASSTRHTQFFEMHVRHPPPRATIFS
jgi:arylsulfatase